MQEIRLPISITYETEGRTSVADVISALQATDRIAKETVALIPSFVDGIYVEQSSLNVLSLTQESPLREALFVALLVTYQEDLRSEVPPVIEDLFRITVDERYDTIATVIFLTVLFYGAGLAIDAAKRAFTPRVC